MIVFALRYSSASSFSIPCDALKTLLTSLYRLEWVAEFAECFRAACELSLDHDLSKVETGTFEIGTKATDYNDFLIELVDTPPAYFLGNRQVLLTRLFVAQVVPTENFSSGFDDASLLDLLEQMLANAPPFPAFVSLVASANHTRFALTWPLFRVYFRGALDAAAMDGSVLDIFLELIANAFCPETEEQILEMGLRFVAPGSNLSLQRKGRVLLQIRQMIARSVSVIKDG
jgi:hypothetical protein